VPLENLVLSAYNHFNGRRTNLFFDGDWRGGVGRRSDTGLVFCRDSEFIDHVFLKALLQRVRRIWADPVIRGAHPFDTALDAVLQHVIRDFGASVRRGRLPRQTDAVLQGFDDLQRQRLPRLLCNKHSTAK